MKEELLENIDRLHTTPMGVDRIRRNLAIDVPDAVEYCRELIRREDTVIERQGKNWYAYGGDAVITVNAYSYTIITAHRKK
jgi:hypothetical protein